MSRRLPKPSVRAVWAACGSRLVQAPPDRRMPTARPKPACTRISSDTPPSSIQPAPSAIPSTGVTIGSVSSARSVRRPGNTTRAPAQPSGIASATPSVEATAACQTLDQAADHTAPDHAAPERASGNSSNSGQSNNAATARPAARRTLAGSALTSSWRVNDRSGSGRGRASAVTSSVLLVAAAAALNSKGMRPPPLVPWGWLAPGASYRDAKSTISAA